MEDKSKVEVKAMVIKIGKKELTLTIEEVKLLLVALEGITSRQIVKEVKIVEEHHHHYPPYKWYIDAPYVLPNTPYYLCGDSKAISATFDSTSQNLMVSIADEQKQEVY